MVASIHIVALSFLAGNLTVHCLSSLPSLPIFAFGAIISAGVVMVLVPVRLIRICGAFMVGFCWTASVAVMHLDDILAPDLEGETVHFSGRVTTIPKQYANGFSFIFQPDKGETYKLPKQLYLKIYDTDDAISVHSRLRITATLKRPYGYVNPGLFDYEKWLFTRRVGGSGYIREYRIIDTPDDAWSIDYQRQKLIGYLNDCRQSLAHSESIAALGLGFSGVLPRQQNDHLVATGTRHLFAVSGLHINLIFGFFVLIIRALWSRFLLARTQYPAYCAALWGALPIAAGYALLAGFSLPTQRALVMLACFVIGSQFGRQLPAPQLLAVAALAVIAYDPLCTLSMSFWLSFVAVALIIFYLSARHDKAKWYHWVVLQAYLSLAMAVLAMLLFSRGAIAAPLANLFAVPFTGTLLLPACLLSVTALWLSETAWLTGFVLTVTDRLFSIFWSVIAWFDDHGVEWFWQPPWWVFGFALSGILLILVLKGARHKLFALLLLLPLLVNQHTEFTEYGGFKADFLDIGQGLSVLIRTRHHTLLFDTGPSFPSGFNTADAVVIPYLRSLGIDKLDKLIVSHNDNDHAGSADIIRAKLHVTEVLSGEPLPGRNVRRCREGEFWIWDGVHFNFLHPVDEVWQGNNASCVLRISNGNHSLLLTADIESAVERIVSRHPNIASNIMLIPHHGSRTSSTPAFIRAVSPDIAVVTSGYRNRYGFPLADILARYRGIKLYNTAVDGMVSFDVPKDGEIGITTWRRVAPRYWRHQVGSYP